MNRSAGRAVAAAVVLAAAIVGPNASAAPAAPNATVRLTLAAQDPWTPLGADLHARLHAEGTSPGLSLAVTVHSPVTDRRTFDNEVGGGSLGSSISTVEIPFDSLPTDAAGDRDLTLGLQSPNGAGDVNRLNVRRTGVYPLEVELRNDQEQSIDGTHFVTFLAAVQGGPAGPTPLPQPLGVAWVWPLVAPPATLPDGSIDPTVTRQLQPDGRLGRQAQALRRATGVPLTLVPGPETIQTWTALGRDDPTLADGVTAVRDALTNDDVITSPYVPVDLPSLLHAGLSGAVNGELRQADDSLRRFFTTRLDGRTALVRPVDSAALSRLRGAGVDRVIVEGSSVGATSGRSTVSHPFALEASTALAGGPMNAVAADTGLARLLTGDEPAALRAQRFLAGLSVVALESSDEARAVVVVNSDGFDPPAALLDAVLAGLRGNPWLRPMSVSGVFSGVPPETAQNGAPITHSPAAYDPPAPPVNAAVYTQAQSRLDAFRSLVVAGDPRVAQADRALLVSVSSAWNPPFGPLRARDELAAVSTTINGFLTHIHVPHPSTITLTARSGDVPLTFRNDTGQPVSVLVQLQSQKLFFPDGASRVVSLAPKSTTVRFAVQSRTSGSFPLHLSVRSVDGSLTIADARFRVRSTVVSTVGLALMIGAVSFLALWWGWDIRRRRRRRMAAAGPPE